MAGLGYDVYQRPEFGIHGSHRRATTAQYPHTKHDRLLMDGCKRCTYIPRSLSNRDKMS